MTSAAAGEGAAATPGESVRCQVPLMLADRVTVSAVGSTGRRTIVAGVSLDVAAGETVGIVGESGSGKSMLAKAVLGLLPAGVELAGGEVLYQGRDLLGKDLDVRNVRGSGIALLLQDPFTMLNPVMRCGEQVAEGLRASGMKSRRAIAADVVRRMAEVGLDETVIRRYPFQLSGGMRQRLALAAALSRDPRLLIADEPSTALDVTTQAEILSLLRAEQQRRGMGLVLIIHDLAVAFSVCDRVYVLYAGSILESGPVSDIQREPRHPYSLGLLLSEPSTSARRSQLAVIEGTVPDPDDVSTTCAFVDRCRWAAPVCRAGRPELRATGPRRQTACLRIEEISGGMRAVQRQATKEELAAAPIEPTSASTLAKITDLRKVFAIGGHQRVVALDGVSLQIGEDESVGLVGESGSGKTTIGRALVGLETATSGTIHLAGVDASVYSRASRQDVRTLRSTAQMVFQDPYSSLDPKQTIGSALAETLRVAGGTATDVRTSVAELMELVGLPESYLRRPPRMLSGGERQRVAIARALAVSPRLLVCDEPVSSLDVSVQAQVLNLLRQLREERHLSYLFITHDLAVVRQIADRLYVLHKGKVVEEGPTDTVLDSPQHWYTKKLLDSVPDVHSAHEECERTS